METASTEHGHLLAALDSEDRFALDTALADVSTFMTREVVTLDVQQPVSAAVQLFSTNHFRHLPVTDGRRLAGLLIDRDAFGALSHDTESGRIPVSSVMIRDPVTIRPEASISEAMHLLASHRVNCLPVTRENRTVHGILTTTDLLRALFATQRWLEARAPRLHG